MDPTPARALPLAPGLPLLMIRSQPSLAAESELFYSCASTYLDISAVGRGRGARQAGRLHQRPAVLHAPLLRDDAARGRPHAAAAALQAAHHGATAVQGDGPRGRHLLLLLLLGNHALHESGTAIAQNASASGQGWLVLEVTFLIRPRCDLAQETIAN